MEVPIGGSDSKLVSGSGRTSKLVSGSGKTSKLVSGSGKTSKQSIRDVEQNNNRQKVAFKPNSVSFSHQFRALFKRALLLRTSNLLTLGLILALPILLFQYILQLKPSITILKENSQSLYVGSITPNITNMFALLKQTYMNDLSNIPSIVGEKSKNDILSKFVNLTNHLNPKTDGYLINFVSIMLNEWYIITDDHMWGKHEPLIQKWKNNIQLVVNKLLLRTVTNSRGIPETISAMARNFFSLYKIKFNTKYRALDTFKSYMLKHLKGSALTIQINQLENEKIKYSIGLMSQFEPKQTANMMEKNSCIDSIHDPDCQAFKYYSSGFLAVQYVLDNAFINIINNNTDYMLPEIDLFVYPHDKKVLAKETDRVGTVVAMSFIVMMIDGCIHLVTEKEKKFKNLMIWMGLRRAPFWAAWICEQSIWAAVQSGTFALLISIYHFSSASFLVLFLLMITFGIVSLILNAIISIFFITPRNASFFSLLFSTIYLVFPAMTIQYKYLSLRWIHALSFIPSFPFLATMIYVSRENESVNIFGIHDNPQSFTIGRALGLMMFYGVFYFILLIFLDQWWEEGIRSVRFWDLFLGEFFKSTQKESSLKEVVIPMEVDATEQENGVENGETVMIKQLKQSFYNHLVLKGIDLSLSENEISCIMGPNGAGKTTLISVMIGEIAPCEGTIRIYGLDPSNTRHKNQLRSRFGVCTQDDIFMQHLTVLQNLIFFARLKGLDDVNAELEAAKFLKDVGLKNDWSMKAKNLSGGQKRKLCIGLALIGRSNMIFLDEPTSGIDPLSRLEIWRLLKTIKKNKTIILTSQSMDEADLLCEKKAFIFKGKIVCFGTSLELKIQQDVGYHIRIDLNDRFAPNNRQSLLDLIGRFFRNHGVERETKNELMIVLPSIDSKKTSYSRFFEELDKFISDKTNQIRTYGLQMTTLEDVFMKLSRQSSITDKNDTYSIIPKDVDIDRYSYKVKYLHQFMKLYKTRLLLIIRNYHLLIQIFVYVIMFYLLNLIVLDSIQQPKPPKKDFPIQNPGLMKVASKSSNDELANIFCNYLENKPFKTNEKTFDNASLTNTMTAVNLSDTFELYIQNDQIDSLPGIMNLIANSILSLNKSEKSVELDRMDNRNITVGSEPLPYTFYESILVILFILFTSNLVILVPALLTCEIVEENELGTKNYLNELGLSRVQYWLALWASHCTIIIPTNALALIYLFVYIPTDSYLNNLEAFNAFLWLYLLYVISMPIFSYPFAFFFEKRETAETILVQLIVIPSICLTTIAAVNMDILLPYRWIVIVWPFVGPPFFMAGIFIDARMKAAVGDFSFFRSDGIEIYTLYSALFNIFIRLILLIPMDVVYSRYGDFTSICLSVFRGGPKADELPEEEEDSDVVNERETICKLPGPYKSLKDISILTIKHLRKLFGRKVVVNNVSFRVAKDQIFGLLGSNGAGKTTILKMLIGEVVPSGGEIYIHENNIRNITTYNFLNYCPQHNPLFKKITLQEHLELFAVIRGVQPKEMSLLVYDLLKLMQITEHAGKKADILSGGTKRKVCLLASIIGNCKLTLLDEPSTGLDPQAKRHMWNLIIQRISAGKNRSMILTTHSMEEVEALCTRTGIMKRGKLKCLGTIQHLKNKYGSGYIAEIKFRDAEQITKAEIQDIRDIISNSFHDSKMEHHNKQLVAEVGNLDSVTSLFKVLEELQSKYPKKIQNYGIFQSSIERIFIEITAE